MLMARQSIFDILVLCEFLSWHIYIVVDELKSHCSLPLMFPNLVVSTFAINSIGEYFNKLPG